MFQAPPPPTSPPPAEVLRTESLNLSIASEDRPVLFVKGPQSERGLVRYQLFQRVEMRATRAQTTPNGVLPPPILCEWVVSVWLQRDPCVESITGRLACMQGYNTRLEDRDRGSEPVQEAAACTAEHPAADSASRALSEAITGTSTALFDADMKRRFAPELSHAGVTLRPRGR